MLSVNVNCDWGIAAKAIYTDDPKKGAMLYVQATENKPIHGSCMATSLVLHSPILHVISLLCC